MAFDLVHYFEDQILIQKPELLNQYPANKKDQFIQELNILSLGKLITLWRENENNLYQEIHLLDHLYIQTISRHLTTAPSNESELSKLELENSLRNVLSLQLMELKQLDETGNLGKNGLRELLLGQVEHLSGQANDWVWLTNNLIELKGTKPIIVEDISLENTVQEFNKMMTQDQNAHADDSDTEVSTIATAPTWSRIMEPIVALAILWIIFEALCNIFAK